MTTMQRLVKRFNRMNPAYKAELNILESYPGYYRVWIREPVYGLTHEYTFTTCRDFREWMDGVVLD